LGDQAPYSHVTPRMLHSDDWESEVREYEEYRHSQL